MTDLRIRLLTLLLVAIACLAPTLARAAEPTTDQSSDAFPDYDPDKLNVRFGLGAWGIALAGHTGVKDIDTGINLTMDDLLKQTNFALFPTLDITKGNWLLSLSGLYANLSDSQHITGPLGISRGANFTSNMGVVDVAVGYTIIRAMTTTGNPFTLTPLIGGRWTYLDAKIDPEGPFESRSQSRAWFDPYVGLTGTVGITRTIDWRNTGTVGGFDVGSQFTWSVESVIDWHVSKNWGVDFGYKCLAWNYDLSGFKWDMTMQGPWIGLFFNN